MRVGLYLGYAHCSASGDVILYISLQIISLVPRRYPLFRMRDRVRTIEDIRSGNETDMQRNYDVEKLRYSLRDDFTCPTKKITDHNVVIEIYMLFIQLLIRKKKHKCRSY